MKEYIGIEIGATKQQIAAFDENGKMLKILSEKVKIVNGAEDIRRWIEENFTKVVSENTVGIGVGFGGIVYSDSGVSDCSVQVKGWENFNIKAWAEDKLGYPTVVVNDTVCGGYAEVLFGQGKGVKYFFYTNIGSGIGGAYFADGVNYDGIGMGGAYLGQIFVPSWDYNSWNYDESKKCEADVTRMDRMCSGVNIEKRLRIPGYIPKDSCLYEKFADNLENLYCPDLCRAAEAGDKFACEELDKWANRYAIALTNFMDILPAERVAIGGGFSNNGDVFFSRIIRETDRLAFCSYKGKYEIVKCKTGDNAVILGAAMYARDGFSKI